MLGLPASGFVEPGPLRDELTALVLAGTKVATSSLVADYVIGGGPLPVVGERAVVIDSAWRLATIGTVDDEFAHAEGEGFADATAWREAHERYWNGHLAEYRRGLRDPDFVLTPSTPVVCERFRLVALIDPATETVVEMPPDRPPG